MPRRHGKSVEPVSEKWVEKDGEWMSSGRATVKGRLSWATRKRRRRVGKIKAHHKAMRSN